MQWSFSNQAPGSSLLSFCGTQEEAPRGTIQDVLGYSGYTASSTSDKLDAGYKPSSGVIREENRYSMRAHPRRHFHPYANVQTQEGRMFPSSKQSNPENFLSGSGFCTPCCVASTGLDFCGVTQLNFGGSPSSSRPLEVPSLGVNSVSTDIDATNQSASKSAQMTIFYNGTVNVYDDISPEKAQAIVLLAGDGLSGNKHKITTAKVQESTLKPSPSHLEELKGNQLQPVSSFSCLANPMISAPPAGQQSGGVIPFKTVGVIPSPIKRPEPNKANICSLASLADQRTGGAGSLRDVATFNTLRTVSSPSNQPKLLRLGSSVASTSIAVPPGGSLPLARKASLARFLERRKDRVTIASPDSTGKRSPERAARGSESASLSLNSIVSCPPSNK